MTTSLPGARSPFRTPGTPAAGTPRPAAGQAPPAGDREESPAGGSRGTVLDAAQLAIVLAALEDAGEYRWPGVPDCGACGLAWCDDHAADLGRAARYAAVAQQLRQEAGR